MQPEVEKYLIDILTSTELLLKRTTGIYDFEAYKQLDDLLKDGILRRLSIIGEAVFQINKLSNEFALTDKKKIAGLCHIIVHDYDKVDDLLIYSVLKKYLPLLQVEVTQILNEKKND